MPDAVIWDLDGVLLDSEGRWDAARRTVAEDAGGHWSDEATIALQGMSAPELVGVSARRARRGDGGAVRDLRRGRRTGDRGLSCAPSAPPRCPRRPSGRSRGAGPSAWPRRSPTGLRSPGRSPRGSPRIGQLGGAWSVTSKERAGSRVPARGCRGPRSVGVSGRTGPAAPRRPAGAAARSCSEDPRRTAGRRERSRSGCTSTPRAAPLRPAPTPLGCGDP